jgi:anhydro-N-acetylmuramic acid kinase
MIIDQLVALHTKQQKQFDEGGAIAASGRVCETLLATLLEDSYFAKCPPKSTGREVYGQEFTRQLLQKAAALQLSFEDTVATATAFTARSIVQSYKDFVLPVIPGSFPTMSPQLSTGIRTGHCIFEIL